MKDDKLIMNYRVMDKDAALFHDMLSSSRHWELDPFVPDIARKTELEKQLAGLIERNNSLAKPDPVSEIVSRHIGDFLDAKKLVLQSHFERPQRHISAFTGVFSFLSRKDIRTDAEKADVLIKRFGQGKAVWGGIKTWLSDASSIYLQEAADNCTLFINTMAEEKKRLSKYFPTLSDAQNQELTRAIDSLCAEMEGWKEDVKGIMAGKQVPVSTATGDDDIIKFEEQYYRNILSNEPGVNLDELLEWHEEEIKKTREEVFEIMGKIKVSDPFPKNMNEIFAILLKYAGPCDTVEEMFRRGRECVDKAKAACREYVWLPDEICHVKEVPEQLKVSYPWGGCGGGDPKSRNPVVGEIFLNNYNFKAVTDGWIKMMAIHEAYVGHHVQFVRGAVDTTPETIKLGAKYTPILEGLAHRSERLFEFIFPDDPFYPLFVAYRRHHTSVRIKADLYLRYYGRPIKDAVELYMEELGFDRATARGQVKAQEFMQGYFTAYYYGMKKLTQWEKEMNLDPKGYTETIISAGKMSIDNFHSFLKLTDDQRRSFTKDYSSILQFGE